VTTFGFRLKTIHDAVPSDKWHNLLEIEGRPEQYCGYTHCKGECGYPALMLTHPTHGELKAHSSMVAAGPVFQHRHKWEGTKVQVLDLDPSFDPNELVKRWWF
jgi:hypothetical protein